MKCKLIGFCDPFGNVLSNYLEVGRLHEVCALIVRLEDHPRIGPPPKFGQPTRTSAIRMVDFARGYLVTQNSVYDFGG